MTDRVQEERRWKPQWWLDGKLGTAKQLRGLVNRRDLELDQALAERDRLQDEVESLEVANERTIDVEFELGRYRKCAEELAEAIQGLTWNVENGYDERSDVIVESGSFKRLGQALTHYESLRGGAGG